MFVVAVKKQKRAERNAAYIMSVRLCSVCGLIVPQEDLPFNDFGICPDVVSDRHLFIAVV